MKFIICLLLSPLAVSLSWAQTAQPVVNAPVASAPQPRVSVLSYGAIGQGEDALTPDAFEREMLYLKEAGYKVLTPTEYLEWRRGHKSLLENAVLLTFREQDATFAAHALPVLQRCGFSYMLMTAEAAATDAACSMVVDDVSFARAVNFGPAVAEKAVLADLEACTPAKEAVPEGVTLPEFSNDDVAEDVPAEEADQVAPLLVTLPAEPAPAATETEVDPTHVVPALAEPLTAPAEPAPAEPAPAEPAPAEPTPAEPVPAEPEEKYPVVEATYAELGKRTPDGDWVTARFKQPLVPREQTQVSVLGYHNFSKTKARSEMRMSTADFCRQMQFLRDSDICVISMQDFLEWRHGTRCLPARCVLITIDDGWKSVHSDAFPVLKAYGYPFTLYLYTRYINVQGDSMTSAQIKEMMKYGATIGSHSSNHLYPSKWKRYGQSSAAYAAQLKKELVDSRSKLKSMFGNCSTYCYPGGYNTPPMLDTLERAGYQAAFTVLESKVTCTEPTFLVHRYMVFGTNHEIFRRAVNFGGQENVVATRAAIAAAEEPAKAFFPAAFEGCTNRGDASPAATSTPAAKPAAKKPARKPAAKKPKKPAITTEPTPEPPQYVTDPGVAP